ncbi:hypothetical protein [Streptomyces sp. NPDC046862]|uniref:hypothetical protein n=1 Tax=Streptomyces sp. NPDC046862 TaxID=3154603 RepID=UPI003453FD28
MLKTIKHASVLSVTTAALALAVAAPAGADELGTQSIVGTAYEAQDFGGRSGALEANTSTCTDIPDVATVRAAANNAGSGQVITLYMDLDCQWPIATLTPGQSNPGGQNHLGILGALAYTSEPA